MGKHALLSKESQVYPTWKSKQALTSEKRLSLCLPAAPHRISLNREADLTCLKMIREPAVGMWLEGMLPVFACVFLIQ